MLIDANLLLYAVDEAAPQHERAATWLTAQLNAAARVGLPWASLTAFVRIVTQPRAATQPLAPSDAWDLVEAWLGAPSAWIPVPTDRHAEVLGSLIRRHRLSGRLIPDAHLVALAIEHGIPVCSADSDFARFSEIAWINPLR